MPGTVAWRQQSVVEIAMPCVSQPARMVGVSSSLPVMNRSFYLAERFLADIFFQQDFFPAKLTTRQFRLTLFHCR